MNIALGRTGLLIALVACALGLVSLVVGIRRGSSSAVRQGRALLVASALGVLIASLAMERAFITHDFSVAYVVSNNSRETPLLFSITGMWSALQGSILLWALVLAGYLAAMVGVTRKYSSSTTTSVALLITGGVLLFFLGLLVGPANPFVATVGRLPLDGQGPNPLLQEYPLVAIHPPFLYLGFVGMTVPFAFASAALFTGENEAFWLRRTRNWSIIAWIALTLGITLGAWWSYQVLGWGGFWAWDPVENSAFLPWLCATAYLHSSIAQQRRFSLRVWNYSLVASAFALTILGTYFTRSGVLQSVHAFSSSTLGAYLIAFFALVVLFAVALVAFRAERLRSLRRVALGMNKESALIINNLLFAGFAFVVLLGTSFPLLVQAVSNSTVTVGTPYFNSFAVPIGLSLLFFMAIAPVMPWRRASMAELGDAILLPAVGAVVIVLGAAILGESRLYVIATYAFAGFAGLSAVQRLVRTSTRANGTPLLSRVSSRANGGMIVHLGVVIVAVAMVSATAFGHQGEVRLARGSSISFFGQRVSYLGVQNVITPSRSSFEANVLINGRGPYHPAISQYGSYTQTVGMPAVSVGFTHDVYVTIDSPPNLKVPGSKIALGVIVQPLISWLWTGAMIMGAGAFLAAFGAGSSRTPAPGGRSSSSQTSGEGILDKEDQLPEREVAGR